MTDKMRKPCFLAAFLLLILTVTVMGPVPAIAAEETCVPAEAAASEETAVSGDAAAPAEAATSPENLTGPREVWEKKASGEKDPGSGQPATEAKAETETETKTETKTETESETEPPKQYNETVQTTEEDIIGMNDGNCTILYSDEGYLTFLRGRYCDDKVLNEEDGIATLSPMASLLGLSRGSEFYAVYGWENRAGYTCYIYQQRYGELTLQNAVLKILVDPDGYTAGLMSSFTPNVGIAPKDETAISGEEACRITREFWGNEDLHIFEEYTRQTSVTVDSVAIHVWAVFTEMPSYYTGVDDRHYLENIVAFDGTYLFDMPVESPEELILGDAAQTEMALEWFSDMQPDTWTGTVTLHDGSTEEITVPVSYDQEGNWYLADTARHILLADCYSFIYQYQVRPWTSKNNGGWPEHYLIVYDRMIKVYDFFAKYGYVSTDGLGAPILLMTDYCDENKVPVDNACFMGYMLGWSTFGFSMSNNFGESIDVVGHEYTHGITRYSVAGHCSVNEAGAINEGLSDIIGNLCEMLMGATDDETWQMGEVCGDVVRCLSFPWLKKQPVCRGGTYYVPTENPSGFNDFGGIHTNCSMITYPAWLMAAQGMDLEQELLLWLDAINLLTPECTFRDVYHALEFAAEMREMDVLWIGKIRMIFEQMGVI